VTDGFTGNVTLKIAEATGRLIGGWIKDAIGSSAMSKVGALLMRGAFAKLKTMLDPDTYGAAPLLGVDGLAFICHGKASGYAIGRAIELAARSVEMDLMPQLSATLDRHAAVCAVAKANHAGTKTPD
jgi:glycerol-3-phosphate acyltransferase PlsX